MTKRKNDFDDIIKDLKKLKITKPETGSIETTIWYYRTESVYNYRYCGLPYCTCLNCESYIDRKWKY